MPDFTSIGAEVRFGPKTVDIGTGMPVLNYFQDDAFDV